MYQIGKKCIRIIFLLFSNLSLSLCLFSFTSFCGILLCKCELPPNPDHSPNPVSSIHWSHCALWGFWLPAWHPRNTLHSEITHSQHLVSILFAYFFKIWQTLYQLSHTDQGPLLLLFFLNSFVALTGAQLVGA